MKNQYISIMWLLLFVIWIISINYSKEGFNTQDYSHTVDMPINNIYSCDNFCGPKSQCAITRDQCTADIDCDGCTPPNPNKQPAPDVEPYEDSGKLSSNQGLHYSSLTNGFGSTFEPVFKQVSVKRPYEGLDIWTQSFNAGLKLYNNKRMYNHGPSEEQMIELPTYPTTVTTTGLFYNTGPTPSNADTY
jgi:hypothetical protein